MQNVSSSNTTHRQLEQLPVNTRELRGVRFGTDFGDILRIVVMSNHTIAQYAPYREYHFGTSAVSVEQLSRITMQCEQLEKSEQAIDAFAKGMSMPLDVPQIVSFLRGIQAPSGAKCRLFKATDPDDNTKMMGLMIEQDKLGNLERVTWYKAWQASAAFREVPNKLEFHLVTDEKGVPSTDPTRMADGVWYFSASWGIGLSASSATV